MAEIPWWVKSAAGYAFTHPAESLVFAYAARHAPVPTARIVWAVGAEMGPATARLGVRVAVIGFESSAVIRLAARGGMYAAAAAAGYAIGATVGTGIAYAGWGSAGAKDALDLYTGQVDWDEYKSTVGAAIAGH